jgi:acyl-coenzyme A synthetase/AMP-(fatty) acid ligase
LRVPVLDNYWQTETGWPVLALLPGVEPPQIRAGSPGIALFGYDAKIVDAATGETLPRGEKGVLAIGLPLPPGCMPTVWRNDQLFERHYCGRFPGQQLYSTFDYATQDEDGYFFVLGRSDDVINVSGHRLGTREIEETVSSHPAVAEVATVGASDDLKGQSVHCFIVLKKPGDFFPRNRKPLSGGKSNQLWRNPLGRSRARRRFTSSVRFPRPDQARFFDAPFWPLPKAGTAGISAPWKTQLRWMRSMSFLR